jgi:hypothetical protein
MIKSLIDTDLNNIKTIQDKNSIIFDCSGAIDFSEQINVELSLTPKNDFIEIHPLDFCCE